MTQQTTRRPAKSKVASGAPATAKARPSKAGAKKTAPPKPRAAGPAVKKKAASAVGKATARKPGTPVATRAAKRPALVDIVVEALEDLKGLNVTVLDVRELTAVADMIVIASGTSDRHVKSLAANVSAKASAAGYRALGREGERDGEWVLVDLSDVIVHVMLPRVREFYGLEKLWDVRSGGRSAEG